MAHAQSDHGGEAHRRSRAAPARDARRPHARGLPAADEGAGVRHRAMTDLTPEIRALKAERRATIVAHNYQRPEIQDLADVVADSLTMARRAAQSDAPGVVIFGAHFMAPTPPVAQPPKQGRHPRPRARCSA